MIYPIEKLKNHIELLSGFAFKSKDFTNAGIPVIKIKNVTPPVVTLDDLSYVSNEIAQSQNRFLLDYNDVLIALTGSHINQMASVVGRVARVRYHIPSLLNQRVGKITVINPDETDLDYVYYYLSQDTVKIQLASKADGAANQANISPSDVKNLDIPYPDINVQRRISGILSAYDTLIENNHKQIKLLEEAAQRLYKEWFVDLRFPGYEDTPIVDGVPEGWEKTRLVDLASVQYGFAFDGSLFNSVGNGMPIIRIRNIPDGVTGDYTIETADNQYIVKNGDIVVGMDGEFHINSWGGDDAFLVQRTCNIKPLNPNMQGWLFWAIYEPIKFFEKTIVGATVAHLGKKHIDTIELLTAPARYYEPFQVIFNKRQTLINENRKLAEARDRLLPKLMSGEMRV